VRIRWIQCAVNRCQGKHAWGVVVLANDQEVGFLMSRRRSGFHMHLREVTVLVAVGGLVAAVAGCGGGKAPGPAAPAPAGGGGTAAGVTGDPARGRDVFRDTCAACHGANAKGLPGLGKNLVNQSEWMKHQDDAALVAFVTKGRPASDPVNTTHMDMPPKGGNPSLTDDDIKNVVAYIRSIQQP
jgi:mono/diheme cytochrome c family protein